MYYNYNDFELIYLINEGVEGAFEELVKKYTYLIRKIHRIKYPYVSNYDFVQEGLMVLYSSLKSYNIESSLSFFTYFNICLYRKLNKVYPKNKELDEITWDVESIKDRNYSSYKVRLLIKELALKDASISEFLNNYITRGMSLKRYCKLTNKCYEKEYYKYKKIIKELRKKVD